jgi:hypothetical protein
MVSVKVVKEIFRKKYFVIELRPGARCSHPVTFRTHSVKHIVTCLVPRHGVWINSWI